MYGNGYLKKVLYSGYYLAKGLYVVTSNALQNLINNCGFILYANSPTGGLMVDEINGYDIVITDISGTPNGGDFIDGNYFKINGQFQEVIDADTTNILYSVGEIPNIIEIVTVANITNDQLIINKIDKTIGFYLTSLSEPCYTDALQFQDLNEGLFDVTGDPLYDIDGNRLYALKDGVTRE